MNTHDLKRLIDQVAKQKFGTAAALERLRMLPHEDLGLAKVDNGRHLSRAPGTPPARPVSRPVPLPTIEDEVDGIGLTGPKNSD